MKRSIEALRIATRGTEQEVQFLSGGTQQKVVLGKWLISDSDIYIFDEPTKGIDVGGKHEIYRLIIDLARQGAGIVFISNELGEVLSLCDRILVMYQGRIVKELSTSATNREEILFYVMGGKDYGQNTDGLGNIINNYGAVLAFSLQSPFSRSQRTHFFAGETSETSCPIHRLRGMRLRVNDRFDRG